ncbi:MAG: hypothetical protein HOE90_15540 [Bacteriovoracaceae bacterium]|jgi:enoyl-CoA hydratase / 3-hydroxyacyl-CoA dehydrogenase|nr:hypothetical protein [Bacteriovoracaceae bacterium]
MKNSLTKIGVVGAGTMGAAIAQHFMMKGMDVSLVDISSEGLKRGLSNLDTSFDEAVSRKIMKAEKKEQLMSGLKSSTDLKFLEGREFIVEAIFENLEIKSKLFLDLESIVSESCILASNTSSFSIAKLTEGMKYKGRCLGVHYFFHAAKNKLVEVIKASGTDPEVVTQVVDFYNFIEKCPILTKDVQGFAVNRFFVPWLNEAARLYDEGIGSTEFIDRVAMETFGVGMGPFALMNATGVPIALHASQTLFDSFGEFYRPSKKLAEQVTSGEQWTICGDDKCSDEKSIVRSRLIAASLGVAAQMVSEGVCDVSSTDLGARLGLRWPAGPFEMMNQIGVKTAIEIVESLFTAYDLPVPEIMNQNREGEIEIDHINTHIFSSTGILEFNRPDSMNALNEQVMACLDLKFKELEQNPQIETIVLTGRGKAFVAGADIKFFVDGIKNQQIGKIKDFTVQGQAILSTISNSKKKTIAFLNGLTLGGGLELALSCDYRVACKNAYLSFPETGIGIYPGLGGTQRTTRLVGAGITKYLVATGVMVDANRAYSLGLVDKIIDRPRSFRELDGLEVSTHPKNENLPEEEFSSFDGKLCETLWEKEIFQNHRKYLERRAPLALEKAMELVGRGEGVSLEEGLQCEIDSLEWIFSTSDALLGLESVINREKVQFLGR